MSVTMGVKEYVQSEFDNVEAEIRNKYTISFDNFLWEFRVLR